MRADSHQSRPTDAWRAAGKAARTLVTSAFYLSLTYVSVHVLPQHVPDFLNDRPGTLSALVAMNFATALLLGAKTGGCFFDFLVDAYYAILVAQHVRRRRRDSGGAT